MPPIFTRHEFAARRRALRAATTPAEALLWGALRRKRLDGRKFRRQHGIGPYIVDFYCPAERLAVELDGAGHDGDAAAARDAARTAFLERHGVRVMRFENADVRENLEGVVEAIREAFGGPSLAR